jgi:hypothetical protein
MPNNKVIDISYLTTKQQPISEDEKEEVQPLRRD